MLSRIEGAVLFLTIPVIIIGIMVASTRWSLRTGRFPNWSGLSWIERSRQPWLFWNVIFSNVFAIAVLAGFCVWVIVDGLILHGPNSN